jgi:putative ABC transport system permease protein
VFRYIYPAEESAMTGKHLIITFRRLRRNLLYAILVIVGLSVGITTFLSTIQWSSWHLSFDTGYPDSQRIFRLTFEEHEENFYRHTARILHGSILNDLLFSGMVPGIEELGRLAPFRKSTFRIGENSYNENYAYACDPGFIKIFQPRVISGQQQQLLTEPHTAVLTESAARKYFGTRDPVGASMEIIPQFEVRPTLYSVVAVVQDLPRNSHFRIAVLTSFDNPELYEGTAWAYVKLDPSIHSDEVEQHITSFIENNLDESDQENITPRLQPLREIHLKSHKAREIQPNVRYRTVLILLVSGMLVFLLAWFNFTLLAFSQNQLQIQRLVIQWQMGATQSDFFRQFLTYNLVVGGISMVAGILLTLLLRPAIEHLGGNYIFQNLTLFFISLGILILLIIFSSLFTALISTSRLYRHLQVNYLSSRQGAPPDTTGRNIFIRAVIVLEFIITFILVSNLTLISKQTSFAKDLQLGSVHPHAIHMPDLHRSIVDQFQVFKEKLLESPSISMVTASMEEPTGQAMDANTFEIDGMDEGNRQLFLFPVDEDFFRFYNLEIVQGDNFPEYYNPADSAEFFVLNESAALMIAQHPEDLLGSELTLHFNYPGFIWPGPVTGIVEDFYLSGLDYEVQPMVIFPKYTWLFCFSVLPAGDPEPALQHLRKVWDELFPTFPLDYKFSSMLIETLYGDELAQIEILKVFSILSIIISGMGLFALSGFFMQRKIKSVALKKINGARMIQLILPELKYYLWLALLSSAISVPASYMLIEQWLRNFKYRIGIPVWIFPASALILVLFSWFAVLYHSIRLARVNPVEFIREQ